jgi:hypothetical protein
MARTQSEKPNLPKTPMRWAIAVFRMERSGKLGLVVSYFANGTAP